MPTQTVTSTEIRETFLRFFEGKGHQRVASSSLVVPHGDPTLFFTNAGMVQFKDVFLGAENRPYTRATTSQKCLRVSGKHNDLEAVGRTARHHTFFEMLGNFSFGDYFKREAIAYAWELLTEVYGLPKDDLWVTIYQDDDEAFILWQEIAGVPPERIVRLGEKDNFWAMGDTGPCGPCSEIVIDRGELASGERCTAPVCGIGQCDCDRWLELWNLVFMQYERDASGTMRPLPKPSIDTGMGLERLTAVLQDAATNWDTDLFQPLIARIQELSGVPYPSTGSGQALGEEGFPHRVIADHARAVTFLIADGVIPSNKERGSALRQILRRAVRLGRNLGLERPFLAEVAGVVVEMMGDAYPELCERQEFIATVLGMEEATFQRILVYWPEIISDTDTAHKIVNSARPKDRDFTRWSQAIKSIRERAPWNLHPKIEEILDDILRSGDVDRLELYSRGLVGEELFMLHDTYGFPRELTEEIAAEHGMAVDVAGFERLMSEQRERARAARKVLYGEGEALERYRPLEELCSRFLGYQQLVVTSSVLALLGEEGAVDIVGPGQAVEIVLEETPFYAESGGQVGDTGEIRGPHGRLQVQDTQAPLPGLIVHQATVEEGYLSVGDRVEAVVDRQRRLAIARNHTATHLLHAALRKVLGTHVQQGGSLVAPDRLRFDFSHIGPMTPEEIRRVEALVNEAIRANLSVQVKETDYQEALAQGALAFFGEKYGEKVRVVRIGEVPPLPSDGLPWSVMGDNGPLHSAELCGGTHLALTGQIGLFRIVSESSIGAGLRRIEAVTGQGAEQLVGKGWETLENVARRLQTSPTDLEGRVSALLEELNAERKRVTILQRELSRREAGSLLDKAISVDGMTVLAAKVEATSAEALREMGDLLKRRLRSGVIVLGAIFEGRPSFVAMVTPDLVARGVHAGKLINEVARVTGGGGGGRPHMAQAGGRHQERLEEALREVPRFLRAG